MAILMAAGPSNVTITLLPVSLSLVHIPRSRLPQLSHPVLRQILQPNPTFLNVTCNEIELSLFAEHHILADFELIARHDRRRLRSRSGSGSARRRPAFDDDDRVEFSCEKWKVLQLDSHSDRLDNSGARVHELSAPLAAAGISILYQSSYMSDFIFVKQSRLREVMSLFGAAGFDLYSSDPEPLMSRFVSPLLSPVLLDASQVSDIGPEFTPESGAVWTRTRSCIDTSVAPALHRVSEDTDEKNGAGRTPYHPSRDKSHSPSCTDVTILPSKLACVGLADESVDSHTFRASLGVTIGQRRFQPAENSMKSRFLLSYPGHEEALIQLIQFHPRVRTMKVTSLIPLAEIPPRCCLQQVPAHILTSLTRIPSVTPSFKPTAKHLVSQVPMLSPVELKSPSLSRSAIHSPTDKQMNSIYPKVSFFSFTRTPEGSSLTTDVAILAALFPPEERHMLICAGELDTLDAHAANSDSDSDSDQDQNNDGLSEGGTLKCLQIDLRRFGLGKYTPLGIEFCVAR
ncbi:hypothetical protein J3R82DRAFT_4187 [Butyriboletus roseoflavus]|nr:hypothetical protein J3R82DRAFT_4187 [Butyriboletus roseoflavus]